MTTTYEREKAILDDVLERNNQKYMQLAVSELIKVHRLSERDAASIMLTVTSVVRLEKKLTT